MGQTRAHSIFAPQAPGAAGEANFREEPENAFPCKIGAPAARRSAKCTPLVCVPLTRLPSDARAVLKYGDYSDPAKMTETKMAFFSRPDVLMSMSLQRIARA